jgi:CRISPR-associated protein Cmr2
VLEHAHHLLDDVAKDGADRDALAIAVLKPGGVTCQWVGKFDTFTQGGDHCFAPLVRAYKRGERGERDGLTSSFLYNLRERFGQLLAAPIADPVARQPISDAFDRDTLRDLFVAEYLHGRREKRDPDKARQELEKARQLMTRLLAVCHQPTPACSGDMRLDLDGARLVKFLALDGKEGVE